MRVEPEPDRSERDQFAITRSLVKFGQELLIRGFVRLIPACREDMIYDIAGRVRKRGYIDSLAQDELDLLPKGARREAFRRINLALIQKGRERRWLR